MEKSRYDVCNDDNSAQKAIKSDCNRNSEKSSIIKNNHNRFPPNQNNNNRSHIQSLIQRAAKSALLDGVNRTGSTIIPSDDASVDGDVATATALQSSPLSLSSRTGTPFNTTHNTNTNINNNTNTNNSNNSKNSNNNNNMKSLEIPSLPAVPDKQDRKRFVGCLAAVLSSMYDYESEELPKRQAMATASGREGEANNKSTNDVSGFFDFYESSDDESVDYSYDIDYKNEIEEQPSSDRCCNNSNKGTKKEEEPASSIGLSKVSSLLSAKSSTIDTKDNFYYRRCQSFESMGSSTTTASATTETTTTTTTTTKSTKSTRSSYNNNNNNNKNSNTNNYNIRNPKTVQYKLKPMTSFRQQQQQAHVAGTSDQKTKLSHQRYLNRRYELYSSLLLSSSELLLLEKSTARAFLPMLSRVLVPQIHKTTTTTATATCIKTNENEIEQDLQQHQQRHSRRYSPDVPCRIERDPKVMSQTSINATRNERKISEENYDDINNDANEELPIRLPDFHLLDNMNEVSPFLDSLTPGAGFRCVSLLLLQHLLTSENGYDARIRHAVKKLSVLVLRCDMNDDPVNRKVILSCIRQQQQNPDEEDYSNYHERRRLLQATRKYEALERNIARRLILLSSPAQNRRAKNNSARNSGGSSRQKDFSSNNGGIITRDQFVRGVKIGGVGIVAGTLFALTGGIAAPGIAAGIAAVAGAAAGTAAVSALTSAAVVTTIFGVGGGGLAAYKMQRRTRGVSEFEFCRETKGRPDRRGERRRSGGNSSEPTSTADGNNEKIEAELFSVLCISGWLQDQCDYQRPWGLQPTHPKILDRLENLERFYSVYSPDHIPKCGRILEIWKGEEDKLWRVLREKYGRDPDHMFPLLHDVNQSSHNMMKIDDDDESYMHGALTLDQEEILDKLFVELGYHSVAPEKEKAANQENKSHMSPFEKMKIGWRNRDHQDDDKFDSLHGPTSDQQTTEYRKNSSMTYVEEMPSVFDAFDYGNNKEHPKKEREVGKTSKPPKHLRTVWDWKTTYGGEMYTVKWESRLLTQICDCVTDFAVDVVSGATRQILKQTVFHTLLSAVIWPSYLLNLANMIDGDWTIAVERADEAGVLLAKTLLYSRAGRRPVTLVGYSFGARIIYSCLKELARYQEEWEYYQELLEEAKISVNGNTHEHARLAKYKQKMKGMREPASIVEDAILMGLPNHLSLSSWRACRQIVAGRLINCYSNKDLILSLMFQAKRFSGGSFNQGVGSILKPVCGTCVVEECGVENIDCSDLILGHQDYCVEIGKILDRIGFGEPIRCISEVDETSVSIL